MRAAMFSNGWWKLKALGMRRILTTILEVKSFERLVLVAALLLHHCRNVL